MKRLLPRGLTGANNPRGRFSRHLFLSDLQIPDHNLKVLHLVKSFIKDFQPDYLYLLGDLINFTEASKYEVVGDAPSLGEEIETARKIIFDLVSTAREANPHIKITWFQGNHCYRLEKYLTRNADKLTDITDEDGERLITIPHIFHLKEHQIEWIPYFGSKRFKQIEIEHGDVVRLKSGYTAHAMLDKRGLSGYSAHSHRLALVTRNQGGVVRFWVESGSLCNSEPSPRWIKKPDWNNGFAIGIYDHNLKVMHPTPILIQKNSFIYNNKLYEGKGVSS